MKKRIKNKYPKFECSIWDGRWCASWQTEKYVETWAVGKTKAEAKKKLFKAIEREKYELLENIKTFKKYLKGYENCEKQIFKTKSNQY